MVSYIADHNYMDIDDAADSLINIPGVVYVMVDKDKKIVKVYVEDIITMNQLPDRIMGYRIMVNFEDRPKLCRFNAYITPGMKIYNRQTEIQPDYSGDPYVDKTIGYCDAGFVGGSVGLVYQKGSHTYFTTAAHVVARNYMEEIRPFNIAYIYPFAEGDDIWQYKDNVIYTAAPIGYTTNYAHDSKGRPIDVVELKIPDELIDQGYGLTKDHDCVIPLTADSMMVNLGDFEYGRIIGWSDPVMGSEVNGFVRGGLYNTYGIVSSVDGRWQCDGNIHYETGSYKTEKIVHNDYVSIGRTAVSGDSGGAILCRAPHVYGKADDFVFIGTLSGCSDRVVFQLARNIINSFNIPMEYIPPEEVCPDKF